MCSGSNSYYFCPCSNSKYYALMICVIIAIFFLVPGVVVSIHNSLVIGLVVAIPAPVILGVIVVIIFAYHYYKESTSEPRYHRVPTTDAEVTVNQEYMPHWMSSQYDPHRSNDAKTNGHENSCSQESGWAHKVDEAATGSTPAIKSFIV